MRIPDPKANTTTEAYLAYKAGYLEESELKPKLYEPYLHFDAWLAYWAGLTDIYPNNGVPTGKNLFNKKDASNGALLDDGKIDVTSYPFAGVSGFIEVEPGDTYVVSGRSQWSVVGLYDADKKWIRRTTNNPVTIPADCYWIKVSFGWPIDLDTVQVEEGDTATTYEVFKGEPEMLCDEEALVAYLSGVTDTYPEDIKDPYDVRIVGYLRHLASIRWPEPDYPVNNEEFYLSTMEPTHASNPVPSSDIELDTAEGKIISVEAYGDTLQQTYTGKNLLYIPNGTSASNGITWTRNGNTVSGTGTGTGSYSDTSGWLSYTLPAGTYTFSIGEAVTKRVQFARRVDSSSPAQTVNLPAGDTSITFTSTEATSEYHVVLLDTSGATLTDYTIKDIQLEAGSEATSFEPYVGGIPAPNPEYPQDIHVVTGEQTVGVTGKNLLKLRPETVTRDGITFTPHADGSFDISGTATANAEFKSGVIPLATSGIVGGQSYTISSSAPIGSNNIVYFVHSCNENGSWNKTLLSFTNSGTRTAETPSTDYVYFVVRVNSGKTVNLTNVKTQIERGSTATEFQPYQTQSYTVDLGSTELCKIGDYQDYIYKSGSDWYLHKEIGKAELGTLNWNATATNQTGIYRMATKGLAYSFVVPATINVPMLGVSSHFSAVPASSLGTYGAHTGVSAQPTGLDIYIYTADYNTSASASDFKTWLTNNNVVLYYAFATPTDTKITDATLVGQLDALANADTYNEKTYISVIANYPILPALLKVEAYKY